MKHSVQIVCAAATIALLCGSILHAFPGPFDGRNFKGRIAFSSDGNYNDEDDWGAFPVAVAMLDACGLRRGTTSPGRYSSTARRTSMRL
ncbi:MAG: hypothetical protein ACYS7Y_21525 [Planctomycetota bacterium]|jgi:hypothetical protein